MCTQNLPSQTMEFCCGKLYSQLFMAHNKMFAVKQCLGSVFCLQYVCSSLTACLLHFPRNLDQNWIHQLSTPPNNNLSSLRKRKPSYPQAPVSLPFITTFQTDSLSSYWIRSLRLLSPLASTCMHVINHYIINSLFGNFLGFTLHHSYHLQPNPSCDFP